MSCGVFIVIVTSFLTGPFSLGYIAEWGVPRQNTVVGSVFLCVLNVV